MGNVVEAVDAALGCVEAIKGLHENAWRVISKHPFGGEKWFRGAWSALNRHAAAMEAVSPDAVRALVVGRTKHTPGQAVEAFGVCEPTAWQVAHKLVGQFIDMIGIVSPEGPSETNLVECIDMVALRLVGECGPTRLASGKAQDATAKLKWLAAQITVEGEWAADATPADPGGRGTWQEAQASLEDWRFKGERFTSRKRMGKRVGCSPATIQKAIEKGSAELQEWADKQRRPSRLNVSPEASALALKTLPQTHEPAPPDFLEQPDVDLCMRFLIEQAKRTSPEAAARTAARIQAMEPAERRTLAEMTYQDTDKAEQIDRRRKAEKLKRRD